MPDLEDGERVEVQGATSVYTISRSGDIRACSCPAWRNQMAPPAQRTCKHLRAYIGEAAEHARAGSGAGGRIPQKPPVREATRDRERRRAILAEVVDSFPVVYDKMLLVYGLRMPRHLAFAIGWWRALTDEEREEAWAYVGTGPCGVSEWFAPHALERTVRDGLDERLQYRYRRDPPELVTVFGGNSDGGHWGLWYDDPAELPRMVVHNWARDSGETFTRKPTLLATFAEDLRAKDGGDWKHRARIVNWFDEVRVDEIEAHRDEQIAPYLAREYVLGGPGPWIPDAPIPEDLGTQESRYQAYKAKAPEVGTWIERARGAIASEPIRAMILGRELYWLDDDTYRDAATELLVAGYRALGRDALAEIARVHHDHRDLQSVHVYAPPPVDPFVEAWARNDREAVAALLVDPLPAAAHDCFANTTDPAMLDVFLAHAQLVGVVERAQVHHATQIGAWKDRGTNDYADMRAPHRAALEHLVGKHGLALEALAVILAGDDAELASWTIAMIEATRPGVLHVACRACNIAAVRALLERGADPRGKNARGELPYDVVKHGWEVRRAAAGEIYDLLRARGGGPPPVVQPSAEWVAGTRVTHAKFGAGTVQSVTGQGTDTKLAVRFADSTKTVLARFVVRS